MLALRALSDAKALRNVGFTMGLPGIEGLGTTSSISETPPSSPSAAMP